MMFTLSSAFSAEITEKQMKEVSKKIIEEILLSSKLNGEYKSTLKHHLEKLMYRNQVITLMTNIAKDKSVLSVADAEKMGFNEMTALRDKSLLTLTSDDLLKLLMLNLEIMSVMTDYECAQYIKKKRTDEDGLGRSLYEISGNLNIKTFKNYVGYYEKAVDNLFSNKGNISRISETELIQVKTEFEIRISELLARDKFIREHFTTGKSFAESTNSDICRIGNELLRVVVSGNVEEAKKRASAYINGQLY